MLLDQSPLTSLPAPGPRSRFAGSPSGKAAAATAATAAVPSFSGGLRDLTREHGHEPLELEGRIPADLEGTLYRIGPARFTSFGRRLSHWFDGDGAVYAVRLAGGRATGAARLVDTRARQAERSRSTPIAASYGTRPPSVLGQLWKVLRGQNPARNPANTNVMLWQGRLYALCEAGLPHELDPATLATHGETDLGGTVIHTMSAHPHRVAERACSYNFGLTYGRTTMLQIYALPDEGPARRLAALPLPRPTMIHDFIATPKHLIFFVSPLGLQLGRMLLGRGSFSECLRWEPDLGTEVIVVPIDDPGHPVRFAAQPFFQWHFARAFERGGELIVDLVAYRDFASNAWLGRLLQGRPGTELGGKLSRAVLDLRACRLTLEERSPLECDFPRVEGAADPVAVASFSSERASQEGLNDRLALVDLETGAARVLDPGPDRFVSEPVLVPRRGAAPGVATVADGYLLSQVYDARRDRSGLLVAEAARLEAGPIGWAWFDQALPFTFHGDWAPAGSEARERG